MAAKYPFAKDCRLLWFAWAALLLGFIPAGAGAQTYNACGPAPAVKAALDQIPRYASPLQTEWQYIEQQRSVLRTLLQQYPDDVFVVRTYRETLGEVSDAVAGAERDKIVGKFKSRHEKNPDDPLSSYLYGYLLTGRDTPQAIKLFESALAKDPQFPWPHYGLVWIYGAPNFLNREQAISHLKTFLNLCPESLEGYSQLPRFEDREMIEPGAVKLRALLEPRRDPDALGAYPTLWSLEFRAHPAAEYATVRKLVAEDLKRLRAFNLQDMWQWYQALETGYNVVKDQRQSDWAKAERVRRFPRKWEIPARERWYAEHKPPNDSAPADLKKQYYTEVLNLSAEWVKEQPYNTVLWSDRIWAVGHLEDMPASEVETIIDQALQAAKSNAGPRELSSYEFVTYLLVAEALSKRGLHPKREVEFAQKYLAQLEIEFSLGDSDYYTKQAADARNFDRSSRRIQGLRFEADGYLRLKQARKAQTALAEMQGRIQDLKTLAGENRSHKQECLARESSYWGLMGRLAEFQNRKADAMADYKNALLKRVEARESPASGVKDELADNALRLWKTMGGTDEGWRDWYEREAGRVALQSNLAWQEANLPVPPFQLTDLHGKTWQAADLKGKVTLLTFWASWCPPCREELLRMPKLIEQYQGRHDVQFLTLSDDADPSSIEPFLKEHQLKLTVLPAHRYVQETLQVTEIPQNWIVDTHGVVRLKGLGYDPSPEWDTAIKAAIEKYKAEAGTVGASP